MKQLKFISILLGIQMAVGLAVAQSIITANGPLEFCHGEAVTLCVEPEYPSYLWNTGSVTQCISVTQSGEYYPVMLDSNGIDSSLVSPPVTIVVHRPEPQVYSVGDTVFLTESFETYQWYRNGSLIEGAIDSFYVITLVGNHYVQVTDEHGCTGVSVSFEIGPLPNGIDDMELERVYVHPNPVTTHVTITVSQGDIRRIALYDMAGREAGPLTVRSSDVGSVSLDVSGLPQGVYIGRVQTGQGMGSFKLVKE